MTGGTSWYHRDLRIAGAPWDEPENSARSTRSKE